MGISGNDLYFNRGAAATNEQRPRQRGIARMICGRLSERVAPVSRHADTSGDPARRCQHEIGFMFLACFNEFGMMVAMIMNGMLMHLSDPTMWIRVNPADDR